MSERPARPKLLALAMVFTLAGALASCASPSASSEAQAEDVAEPEVSDDSAEASDAEVNAGSASTGEAIVTLGDDTYTAELEFCTLSAAEDALFHGPAYDDSGSQVGYLDGDFVDLAGSPYGEARLDFGATRNMQSTDDFFSMGSVSGEIVVTDASDTNLIVVGGAWDAAGEQLGTATLKVNC